MNTQLRSENPPPERSITRGDGAQIPPPKRFSSGRLVLAFILAALADGLSIFWALTPPVQWAADLVTAISLFIVLGWQWILLPGLIMEAIPGVYIFPFWLLVIAAVAMWGTVRPKLKSRGQTSE
jgi:hypothetical protein